MDADPGSIAVVDLSDYKTVENAVASAKVVINAIGRYWKFGGYVVRCGSRYRRKEKEKKTDRCTWLGRARSTASITLTSPLSRIS